VLEADVLGDGNDLHRGWPLAISATHVGPR